MDIWICLLLTPKSISHGKASAQSTRDHAQVRLDISPTIFQDALQIFMQAPVFEIQVIRANGTKTFHGPW
ncbi:MAG: hypothetical protein ABWY08_06075 [Comamonas sp.]